uniref:Uncharacterized protein n=1 Tax=Paramormyrops kingsleyae TaxID=1676925 RepID=A0A3B3QTU8_9TELE
MVYVSNGQVLDSRSRSPLRLSFWTDLFWVLVCHFSFIPDLPKNGSSRSHSRYDDGRGPPPRFPGPRRMGRINHGGGPSAPPMGGGG